MEIDRTSIRLEHIIQMKGDGVRDSFIAYQLQRIAIALEPPPPAPDLEDDDQETTLALKLKEVIDRTLTTDHGRIGMRRMSAEDLTDFAHKVLEGLVDL